jgi:hypothetical protein
MCARCQKQFSGAFSAAEFLAVERPMEEYQIVLLVIAAGLVVGFGFLFWGFHRIDKGKM